MAVSPTASWFEYLDVAGAVLTQRLLPVDGMVTARGPGLGLDCDETAVAGYLKEESPFIHGTLPNA
jgi:mandelate racemase